jgi:tetratricopeptide (TPR) repeat protein
LESFLAQDGAAEDPSADRIAALRWAGEIAGLLGDPATAEARLAESLALARRVGDKRGIAAALGAIGSALVQHGDVAASIAPLTEAATLTRELGDVRQTAFLLAYLAIAVGHQGDLARAEVLIAESEELRHVLGDTPSFEAILVLLGHGLLALLGGAYDRAEGWLESALTHGRALDAKAMVSTALGALGEVAQARGHAAQAAGHFREGLIQGSEGDYPVGIAWNMLGLVRLGSHQKEVASVARLVGALDAFPGTLRALPGAVVAAYEVDVERMRAVLGEETFARARNAGQASSLEEMIAEALALADTLVSEQH